MKILFKLPPLNGGSPKSILEHIKILSEDDFEFIICAELENTYSNLKVEYEGYSNKIYDVGRFKSIKSMKTIIQNLEIIKELESIIINEKPNLLVAQSIYEGFNLTFLSKKFEIPLLIIQPGGIASIKYLISDVRKSTYLVFSNENYNTITAAGVNLNSINVISNRIDIKVVENWKNIYLKENCNTIKILFPSRMEISKFNSIDYLMNVIDYIGANYDVTLDIAGDGEYKYKVELLAEHINNKHKKKIINLLGYRNDIADLYRDYHIVVGKGRSVIEPILSRRLGIVVGDENNMDICEIESFNNLYNNNFSGRNLCRNLEVEEFCEIISSLNKSDFNIDNIEVISLHVGEYYDIKKSREKIVEAYKKAMTCEVSSFDIFSRYYILYILFNYIKIIKKYITLKLNA